MNCKVDITWYKDVRAYADKLERNYRPSHKSYTDRGSSFRRYSGSKHSKRRSPSRGISISSVRQYFLDYNVIAYILG